MADPNESQGGLKRRELPLRRGGELLIGRLKDHGAANYQFRASEEPSYYVKVLTSRGERTLWGKDLERAIKQGESKPKTGDLIGARRIRREAVIVTNRERDGEGRIVREEAHHAHRTRWVVEKVTFFAERARLARRLREEQTDLSAAVRERPELRSTFLSHRAAEEFAAKRIANPEDRARFLELVKGAMASSIAKGEPLPSVSLRQSPGKAARPVPSSPDRKREEPTR